MAQEIIQINKVTPIGKRRVCAYTRVSSKSEDQENSLAYQIEAYTKMIMTNPSYEFCGVFVLREGLDRQDRDPAFRKTPVSAGLKFPHFRNAQSIILLVFERLDVIGELNFLNLLRHRIVFRANAGDPVARQEDV